MGIGDINLEGSPMHSHAGGCHFGPHGRWGEREESYNFDMRIGEILDTQ